MQNDKLEIEDLDENADDFLETYLATNPDLKVLEVKASPSNRNKNRSSLKAQDDSSVNQRRYSSRMSLQSAKRPLSKNQDPSAIVGTQKSSKALSSSRNEHHPTMEDNFEQYSNSIGAVEELDPIGESVAESFNQYEDLDKFLENDRR